MTLRLMWDIERKRDTDTWCGFPHNLLLPRSRPYDPASGGGGTSFVLFAFVSDVAQEVEEGMDGIEHMSDWYHCIIVSSLYL